MGPIERLLAAIAGALAAAAPADQPPAEIQTVEIGPGAPTEIPPLPEPRPDRPSDPGLAFAFENAALAYAPNDYDFPVGPDLAILSPPLPEPNPLAVGAIEVAALPPLAFGAVTQPGQDASCLAQLAALPLAAVLMPPVEGEGACGIATPLTVDAIGSGRFEVDLVPEALVDCSVAGALTQWLEEDVQPAAHATLGQWVTGIRVAASYACRGRNNDPSAPLSEHAFGNAIDISAFRLEDGSWIEVQPFADEGGAEAAFFAAIRSEACGTFTTVLGPGVAYHDDHFHLDLAARGSDGWSLYCPQG